MVEEYPDIGRRGICMRITNKMMTNSMMMNINKNKNYLSRLDEQYSSGKKIQRPSEDPIVAVRALKLRTNLSELNQYYERNIPDAKSWMDVTESALDNINEILTKINTDCVEGSNDPLEASDRNSIVQRLVQYKKQIYQEGNSNYAGRYVFTGYKTDSSLSFTEYKDNLDYSITEKISGNDIDRVSKVLNEYKLSDYSATPPLNTFSTAPEMVEVNRIRLAYEKLDAVDPSKVSIEYSVKDPTTGDVTNTVINTTGTTITVTDSAGTVTTTTNANKITLKTSTDADTYKPGVDDIFLNTDTGEILLGSNMYNNFRVNEDFKVSYMKTEFYEGDLKPEHYFDCKVKDNKKPELGEINYTKQDQQIQYEINFNQKLSINTQASDAIQHDIGRNIDEVVKAVEDVIATEKKIAEVEEMLKSSTLTGNQKESLESLKEKLNTTKVLKEKIMHDAFAKGNTASKEQQETLNVAVSNHGSRYVRLQLTESRLSDQQVDYEDLLSTNEDVDLVDTYIKLNSAETVYNASLSSAAKIVKNTLLDFI